MPASNVIPLNERGAAYLKDLEERAERERRQREIAAFIRLTTERPAPTYTLTDWFRGKKSD